MSELGIRLWMRRYAYPFTGLAWGHAGGGILVLRWDGLYEYLLSSSNFFDFVLGEIWKKYTDGGLCISSWYSKAEPP